jgi:branched-chain amino acid transport system permease protein
VNADRISAVAFGIGTAFAAAAGSGLATLFAFTPEFGRSFLLKSFCIIVLAGMESVAGVALGALVLALLESAVGAYTSIPTSFQDALSFTLLVVALVAFPQGLLGLFSRLAARRRAAA